MLRQRVYRAELLLRRRERGGRAGFQEATAQVAALRTLLLQLDEADPFPGLEAADYLRAFWPWLLAGAERWPVWAVDYALAVGGLPAAVGRLARRGPPPKPQPLQDARDVVQLVHEQVEAVRADGTATLLERARAIGYLAGIARKAIETGTLAARLEMLEAVLTKRKGGTYQ
jgi:hypothetical protein